MKKLLWVILIETTKAAWATKLSMDRNIKAIVHSSLNNLLGELKQPI